MADLVMSEMATDQGWRCSNPSMPKALRRHATARMEKQSRGYRRKGGRGSDAERLAHHGAFGAERRYRQSTFGVIGGYRGDDDEPSASERGVLDRAWPAGRRPGGRHRLQQGGRLLVREDV